MQSDPDLHVPQKATWVQSVLGINSSPYNKLFYFQQIQSIWRQQFQI